MGLGHKGRVRACQRKYRGQSQSTGMLANLMPVKKQVLFLEQKRGGGK